MEKKPDHKKLYEKYHASPEAKKDRAARNRNRREFEAEGRVSKGDGKEIDHKVPLSKGGSNDRSNLRVVSRTTNRAKRDRPS
mgnify:CR=1 FL=1